MKERLNDLETKVAFLEKSHDELSDVVYALSQKVAVLEAKLERLRDVNTAPADTPRSLEDDKPPHY